MEFMIAWTKKKNRIEDGICRDFQENSSFEKQKKFLLKVILIYVLEEPKKESREGEERV